MADDDDEVAELPAADNPLERIDKAFGNAVAHQQFEGIVGGFRRELDAMTLKLNAANAKIEYLQSESRSEIARIDRTIQSLIDPTS